METALLRNTSAFIDTLCYTFTSPHNLIDFNIETIDDLKLFEGVMNDHLEPLGLTLGHRNQGGRNFYKYSYTIDFCQRVKQEQDHNSESIGFVAVGGNSDTACVYLTGFGCEYLNLSALMPLVRSQLESVNAKITRADTAYDSFDGEYSVDLALGWWQCGAFTTRGNKPLKYCQHGCWLDGHSRTFEIGSRESTKFMRIYEKGHQLGDMESSWTRWEIEWKAKNKAVIPYDILTSPGRYLSESYDCMSFVPDDDLDGSTVGVRYAVKTKVKLTIDQYQSHCRNQYGKIIHVLQCLGIGQGDILARLSRCGVPDRLVVPPDWNPPSDPDNEVPF